MVDVAGHVGMALVWLGVVWFVVSNRRTAAVFVLIGLPFGLFPDIDLYLRRIFPTLHHHGVVHTVLAVSVVGIVAGTILARTLVPWLADRGYVPLDALDSADALTIGVALLGGYSHLFADILSAPDISQPIEPFWPLYMQPVSIDVFYYTGFWATWGLLGLGLLVQGVLSAAAES
jgi:inner membrane protein